ncbi:MAG: hypothetical protein WC011_00525 [Candidatus Paceibacterota bacterium]
MSTIILLILGYFIFGYFITLTKIKIWNSLIQKKTSFHLNNLSTRDSILCALIFPLQFYSWMSTHKSTSYASNFKHPILPFRSLYFFEFKTGSSINRSVMNNEKYYKNYQYEDGPKLIKFVYEDFLTEQYLNGIFLGYLHILGYFFAMCGCLGDIIFSSLKFLYYRMLRPSLLCFYIK